MVVTDTCCRSAFLRSSSSRKIRFLLEPCRCCLKALACVTAARPFRRTSECHSHFHLIIRARNASTAVRPGCRRHNKSPLENANDQPPGVDLGSNPSGTSFLRLGKLLLGSWQLTGYATWYSRLHSQISKNYGHGSKRTKRASLLANVVRKFFRFRIPSNCLLTVAGV